MASVGFCLSLCSHPVHSETETSRPALPEKQDSISAPSWASLPWEAPPLGSWQQCRPVWPSLTSHRFCQAGTSTQTPESWAGVKGPSSLPSSSVNPTIIQRLAPTLLLVEIACHHCNHRELPFRSLS